MAISTLKNILPQEKSYVDAQYTLGLIYDKKNSVHTRQGIFLKKKKY